MSETSMKVESITYDGYLFIKVDDLLFGLYKTREDAYTNLIQALEELNKRVEKKK